MGRGPIRLARKAVVGIVGGLVVVVGIILIPLPGPGTLIVFAGLAILATEYPAARRFLDRAKGRARRALGMAPRETADEADAA